MRGDFELIERDGLARICRLETGHGTVETPALLPVINPNRKLISASEMRSTYGTEMVITNSYIISRSAELREKALKEGVHSLLGFDGPIMTDSGTFQTHVYNDVTVDPADILEFQKSIGSDVATVFDIFSEPDFNRSQAEHAAETTRKRVEEAMLAGQGNSLIAATVQGGIYQDIRENAARGLTRAGPDYFSIGGVVPLMENHRFSELVDVIVASKKGLAPGRPVHLFGAGHPLMLPIAVLLGCDIFDSASYVKYAYDGRMMFPDGSFALADMKYGWCSCPVCSKHTPAEILGMEKEERVLSLARHNLHILTSELRRVKQAIHEGSLWNLVEERARTSPALADAYERLIGHADFLERFEPLSRRSGVKFTDPLSLKRPGFRRFFSRATSVRPGRKKKLHIVQAERQYFTHYDHTDTSEDEDTASMTRVGIFPIQLTETYPLAQSAYSSFIDCAEDPESYATRFGYESFRLSEGKWKRGGTAASEGDRLSQVLAVLEHQFGTKVAGAIVDGNLTCTFSRNTGKLRTVHRDGKQVLFFRTEDGLFSLKYHGGEIIHDTVHDNGMAVVCSDDAAPFVSAGKSLFTRFVVEADDSLRPGDECLVVDRKGELLAVGRTLLRREEMLSFRKGVAVDIRDGRSSSSHDRQPERMK